MPEPKPLDGPPGYPLVGQLFSMSPGSLHKQATVWRETYGDVFVIYVLGKRLVFISSREIIQEAFDSSCSACINDRCATFIGGYLMDKSIGMSNDTCVRTKLRPLLVNLLTKSLDSADEGSVYLAQTCADFKTLTGDVNTCKLLKKTFQDYLTKQLIGSVIPEGDPDRDILWEFIDSLYVMIDPSVDGPLKMFPFLRHLPGYYGDVYRQTIAARNKVAKRLFEDQKATYVSGRIRGLVDVCIKTQQEETSRTGSSWLTDEYIKGLIFDTLAAGMTELMKSLRLFILLMCHHPGVQTKLQAEIDGVIGTERFPSGADRQWMPYTQAVMMEAWRYGSQTPLAIPHLCSRDVIVDNYLIEKGSLIFANLYGVHHDDAIWGDPWEFRPERFLDTSGALLPRDHVFMKNVIPFSIGKRACPGQDFARSRVFIGMTSLLQRVRIAPPEKSALPSADPRLYTKNYPLTEPRFDCRFLSRENIII